MKKIFIVTIISLVMMSCCTSYAKDFTDLDSSHWAYTYVNTLSNEGVINGYEDGSYRPQNSVTKAEFLKLMVCSDSKAEKEAISLNEFKVQGNWYDAYIDYVKEHSLSLYARENENYNEPIKRLEIATYIYTFSNMYDFNEKEIHDKELDAQIQANLVRVVLEKGLSKDKNLTYEEAMKIVNKQNIDERNNILESTVKDISYKPATKKVSFKDVNNLLSLENDSIYETERLGIMNGYEDGTFKPKNNVTRAEVSAIIYRWKNLLKEKGVS